ncbi:Crp/Fnr family transcriptional regulator [Chryseobacterium wangxinyae]|uniref:Crp/Fnr family transcriptional regulator n=1 Tax=Chryseobacterium sp. CY353 TaxID=2997334 RepID=UPI0022702FCD|nr:Crp/Fnr family transcriptional regulator [Chryseobacterium sp. CY353]MCY0970839.1 Crp/Fnr family transcriptional regulator [Chryseobacterium sp. CY353]
MMLGEDLLLAYGGKYENYTANDLIFAEGSHPNYYFQIINGTVELNNYHFDGREFVQNIFSTGQSFGESLLFGNHTYPMNAIARTQCTILKIAKLNFLTLLTKQPEAVETLCRCLSDRLYNKYKMLFSLSSSDPIFKIKIILDDIKGSTFKNQPQSFEVPLTRQQLANLTGLRVETVIRAVKKMEKCNILKIEKA